MLNLVQKNPPGARLPSKAYSMPKTQPHSPEKIRQGFIALAESLLASLLEVFPECDALDAGCQLFRRVLKGDASKETAFIHEFQAILQRHAEPLKRQEEQALFQAAEELPLLRNVDLRKKWGDPGFTEESKKHFWQYLASLKIYADLFCSVPTEILGKIESVAGEISSKLQAGSFNLSEIDVREIGNELLGQLSQEEVKTFEASLPSIFSSLTEMASSISAQVGGGGAAPIDPEAVMKVLLEKQQEGGPLDVSSLMQSLGGALPLAGLGGPQSLESLMQLLGGVGGALPPSLSAEPAAALEDERPRKKTGKK